MSIQITIRTSGLNISANIKDSALTNLMTLIQEQRDDTVAQASPSVVASASLPPSNGSGALEGEGAVKAVLCQHGAAELLNLLKWDSYPEKILLLGSWLEAKGDETPWRSSDMDDVFSQQAKEKPPGNFPRDISKCIKSGWINAATPRTYVVTRTGWNKVGQALGAAAS